MTARNWALLLFLSLLWGGSFFFYKVLVAVLPPVTVVAGRVAIAALALNLWLWTKGTPLPLSLPLWKRFALLGILNNVVPFILIAWGETRIDSGLAAILPLRRFSSCWWRILPPRTKNSAPPSWQGSHSALPVRRFW